MRKSMGVLIIFIVMGLVIWTLFPSANRLSNEQILVSTFSQSKSVVLMSNISFNGLLSNRSMQVEELRKVTKEIVGKLNINMISMEEEENSSDTYAQYYVTARTMENNIAKIKTWSQLLDKEGKAESYIQLELYQDYYDDNFSGMREKIQKVLNPYTTKLKVTSSVTGTYNGKLDDDNLKMINEKVFGSNDKKKASYKIQEDSTNAFVSSSLFTQPSIFNQGKGNLQLSIRYNESENQTYITLNTLRIVK
ncbi:MAG: YwmB family TATA-box binding protein [Clostridia bacterium]